MAAKYRPNLVSVARRILDNVDGQRATTTTTTTATAVPSDRHVDDPELISDDDPEPISRARPPLPFPKNRPPGGLRTGFSPLSRPPPQSYPGADSIEGAGSQLPEGIDLQGRRDDLERRLKASRKRIRGPEASVPPAAAAEVLEEPAAPEATEGMRLWPKASALAWSPAAELGPAEPAAPEAKARPRLPHERWPRPPLRRSNAKIDRRCKAGPLGHTQGLKSKSGPARRPEHLNISQSLRDKIYSATVCEFWPERMCKRGKDCKFLHADFDETGKLISYRPTVFSTIRSQVALRTPEDIMNTVVLRSEDVGKYLRLFLDRQRPNASLILGQCVRSRERCSFLLNAEDPNALVQAMGPLNQGLSPRFVRASENEEDEHIQMYPPQQGDNHHTKTFYHCTSLQGALGALVTGHLVAGTGSKPYGCYFSPSLEDNKKYDEGVSFEANLYGLQCPRKQVWKFNETAIPMGVVARIGRNAKDVLTDSFSHKLTRVTFKVDALKSYLQTWFSGGKHKIPMPIPELPHVRSHRMVVLGEDAQYYADIMADLDNRFQAIQTNCMTTKLMTQTASRKRPRGSAGLREL